MSIKKLIFVGIPVLVIIGSALISAFLKHRGSLVTVDSAPTAARGYAVARSVVEKLLPELQDGQLMGASVVDTVASASELSAYSGFGHQPDVDEDTFTKEENAREELIARCMENNGFNYIPSPSILVDTADIDNPEKFAQLLVEAAADPNEAYVNSLSEDKLRMYYVALTGMEDPNSPGGQGHELSKYSDSCMAKAFHKIPGVYAKRNELREAFNSMEENLAEDQRLIEATQLWSNCMAENNYSFLTPRESYYYADQQMVSLLEVGDYSRREEQLGRELASMRRATEDCIQRSKLRDIKKRLRIEYENQFVKRYRKQLDYVLSEDATLKSK